MLGSHFAKNTFLILVALWSFFQPHYVLKHELNVLGELLRFGEMTSSDVPTANSYDN